ncbi:hypothetical protein GCM10010156_57650 [Planobispora rosea]|uniref:DUF4328 domain-containing protein n=1 Tax=Planobispora rosea TaxID=35762 RepID=A0A8J3S4K9_PLARO|nr:DUF4328 domain-containing protein [Planobispora rosea]GGS91854.1 hypothetical protein GCM10010156_57650 [Planobispora rosea]GIH87068.1 hypothetical protein Pro02_54760 [Planobispora rosea]
MRPLSPSRRRSASAVYAALAVQVLAVAALVVFEQVRGARLALEIAAFDADAQASGARAVAGAATVFALLILSAGAATISVIITYLLWLVRMRPGAGPAAPSVRSLLGGWFVPVVNLAAPPVLLDRLWQGCRPAEGRRSHWLALLAAWWLSWLAAIVLIVRLPFSSHAATGLTGLGPAELAAVALSAVLCAATVQQITGAQTSGARHRRPAKAAPALQQAVPNIGTPAS